MIYSTKGGSGEYSMNVMHIVHALEFCQRGKFQQYALWVMPG